MSEDLDRLRNEMNENLKAIQGDIRGIHTALTELVRLDSKLNSQDEMTRRIGRQVDALEHRVRAVETEKATQNIRIGTSERMVWVVITGLLGLAFAGLKTGFL